MSVDRLQCPNCGAPLPAHNGVEFTTCGFCGAGIRVKQGSSGHRMAILTSIKDDTSILVKTALLQQFEKELADLQTERAAISRRSEPTGADTRMPPRQLGLVALGLVAIGLLFLLAAQSPRWVLVSLIPLIAGAIPGAWYGVLWWSARRRRAALLDASHAQLHELDGKIRDLDVKIRRLKSDLHDAASRM